MSEKTKAVWQDLPDLIFCETMMLLALEELQKCRQVCKIWNVMISKMSKNKKNIIWSKAESLATQIGDKMVGGYKPNLAEIHTLASLAHHGIPISVKQMFIQDVNCDVVPILLDNIKCIKHVTINQTLGSEGTQSLVRAMESNVECICLGPKTNLDIAVLNQYSGEGKCWLVVHHRYRDDKKVVEVVWRWGYTTWSNAVERIDTISKLNLFWNTICDSQMGTTLSK